MLSKCFLFLQSVRKSIDSMAKEKFVEYPHEEKETITPPEIENGTARSGSGPPDRVLKHAHDADEAMKAFEGLEGEVLVLDGATNNRLLSRIDRNIMPVRCERKQSIHYTSDHLQASVRNIRPQLP